MVFSFCSFIHSSLRLLRKSNLNIVCLFVFCVLLKKKFFLLAAQCRFLSLVLLFVFYFNPKETENRLCCNASSLLLPFPSPSLSLSSSFRKSLTLSLSLLFACFCEIQFYVRIIVRRIIAGVIVRIVVAGIFIIMLLQ